MKAIFYVLAVTATALGLVGFSSAEGPVRPVQAVEARRVTTQLEADAVTSMYLDQIEGLVARGASPAASLSHLQKHLGSLSMASGLRSDMIRSINYLSDAVGASRVTVLDAQLLRKELVDARLHQATLEFQHQAKLREWSPVQLHRAVMEWVVSTSIFDDAPNPFRYRLHMAAALERSMLQSTGTTSMSKGLTIEVLRERLYTAIRRLDASRAEGFISQNDYDRFREIAVARARMIVLQKF